ncbi:Uncharacterised protein [Serratia fonticola]|uniref:Uncharacterized protein n=1 Tax=Serratia fonticola TaxID=47917 RepID=A0A4V6KK33_SERFO|nr:Uncharacterised protein [Serratia fonticola]
MVLGAIVSLYNIDSSEERPLLKSELMKRISLLSQAFRNIVFAQVKNIGNQYLLLGYLYPWCAAAVWDPYPVGENAGGGLPLSLACCR